LKKAFDPTTVGPNAGMNAERAFAAVIAA
jgi:hypothetical protein